MNERIKNLFIQAGGHVEEENGNLWTYNEDLDPELFAELIVRECIDATGNCAGTGNMIEEHFGVKE